MADHLHSQRTQRSNYQYIFTDKHHGGDATAARWSPELSETQEFSVFDIADLNEVCDDRQWLYGVLRDGERRLIYIGTWKQQLAAFPVADEGQPWHGYPLYPLIEIGPPNRRGEKSRPQKTVFEKMERAGLLTKRQRKRLYKGDHASD